MQTIFGNWKIIKEADGSRSRHLKFVCECLGCNKIFEVFWQSLKKGVSTQCNTCRRSSKHRASHTDTYRIWSGMKTRCYNKNAKTYHFYGAKGIKVSEEWHVFENFLHDMGPRPEGYAIDRINPSQGYSKENCRWISKKENCSRQNNRLIDMAGKIVGKWTVLHRDTNYMHKSHAYWMCRCECGTVSSVAGSVLRKKNSMQCYSCKNEAHKGWYERYRKRRSRC